MMNFVKTVMGTTSDRSGLNTQNIFHVHNKFSHSGVKRTLLLAPSGALVFIMVYYIPSSAAAPTFPNFSNSSDSKVKVKVKGPNMCYIFEKHGIQGYRI